MRALYLVVWLAGAIFLIPAERLGAQATSSAVLNSLEVQELIKRALPADHARLEVHFAVLAEVYDAEARRHSAMAQAFIAKPTRQKAANSAADHCKRLEQLNLQSAATLRQLAGYHEGLAAGKASAVPHVADRFERGAGAPAATTEEVAALAAKASTPGGHRALQDYFATLAKQYATDVDDHLAMAQAYRSVQVTQAAVHCDRLVA